MISRAKKWVHNARWKAFFTLNLNKKPNKKEIYQFKSTAPAPHIIEMKVFEDRFANLVKM